jgi:hypothetical protein
MIGVVLSLGLPKMLVTRKPGEAAYNGVVGTLIASLAPDEELVIAKPAIHVLGVGAQKES